MTGLNEAFVIDQTTREAIIAQAPQSSDLIKPFLEGKDIKAWHFEARDLWLILLPRGWTIENSGITQEYEAWQWLQENHPTIAKHLQQFASQSQKRGDKGDFWWELRTCAYYGKFEKPKIIYAHFQSEPLFLKSDTVYLKCTLVKAISEFFPSGNNPEFPLNEGGTS